MFRNEIQDQMKNNQVVFRIGKENKRTLSLDHSLISQLESIKTMLACDPKIEQLGIPSREGFEFIPYRSILYLESDNNYTWLHLEDGVKHLVCKTLKQMEVKFEDRRFHRVHKSYYVNLNQIARYIRGNGGYLILRSGCQIPVSRTCKHTLLEVLDLT